MALFPRLPVPGVKALWRQQTLNDLDNELEYAVSGRPTFTGIQVGENTALNYSAVYACVRVRGEALGSVSLHLYQRKDKGAEKATWLPLYRLVHDRPNADMTSVQFRETLQAHLDTWGNCYCLIDMPTVGRNAGQIRQLYPLKPDRMRVYRDQETKRLKYEYRKQNADGTQEKTTYNQDQILHIAGLGYDGVMGYSPIALMRQAIGIGLAIEQFSGTYFGNGAHVGGVVTLPQPISPNSQDGLTDYRKKLKEEYAGLGKTASLMVLAGQGATYTPITLPLEDMQLLSLRKFQLEEIARIYRVPLHKIADLDKATFSNIEHQSLEFVMDTMMPLCRKWEQALNATLLTENEREDGYYFEFDLNSLLRGDYKSRMEGYKIGRELGMYSPNDLLRKENENPRTDGKGDEYWDEGPSGQGKSNKTADASADANARLRASLKPVLDDAKARIARREQQDVQREAKKGDLDAWLNEHEGYCARVLAPYFEALGAPDEAKKAAESRVNALRKALESVDISDNQAVLAALTEVKWA
jgi:HK97 family phage portal protein